MEEETKTPNVSIDRGTLDELLATRKVLLSEAKNRLADLQKEVNFQVQQVVGLEHRVNELTEILK